MNRPSAVLIAAYPAGGEVRVVLVERGSRGVHGGQVGLPGGKAEAGDKSLLETALREAEEEIGLRRCDVKVLAELEAMDTRTTGFRVHSFLARVPGDLALRPREGEIASVFTVSVSEVMDRKRRGMRKFEFAGWGEARESEAVVLENGLVLWGLTLRILDVVGPRIVAGEWGELGGSEERGREEAF